MIQLRSPKRDSANNRKQRILKLSNLAEAILRYVAAETMPALVGQLMMGNLVYRNFESTIGQAGAAVSIPIPPVMQANNIAETGSVQLQAPSLGNATISLDSHVGR